MTQIIVGINALVFAAMVVSGVSPLQPTIQQLVTWGQTLRRCPSAHSPGGCLPRTTFISDSSIFSSTCGACGTWAGWRNASSIAGPTYWFTPPAGGSLASLWWHPRGIEAGASGAIFGLAGALIAVLYLGKLPISKDALKPTLKSLITFAAYNLFFGLVPGIDNAAHLGGLSAGLGLGAVLARSVTEPRESRARWRNYVMVGTALLLLGGYNYVRQKAGH